MTSHMVDKCLCCGQLWDMSVKPPGEDCPRCRFSEAFCHVFGNSQRLLTRKVGNRFTWEIRSMGGDLLISTDLNYEHREAAQSVGSIVFYSERAS